MAACRHDDGRQHCRSSKIPRQLCTKTSSTSRYFIIICIKISTREIPLREGAQTRVPIMPTLGRTFTLEILAPPTALADNDVCRHGLLVSEGEEELSMRLPVLLRRLRLKLLTRVRSDGSTYKGGVFWRHRARHGRPFFSSEWMSRQKCVTSVTHVRSKSHFPQGERERRGAQKHLQHIQNGTRRHGKGQEG